MSTTVSPLAPKSYPEMPEIEGVQFATASAGIKYKGRTDVLLATVAEGTAVAGVFTRSKCSSAPVDWCKARVGGGKASRERRGQGRLELGRGGRGERPKGRGGG